MIKLELQGYNERDIIEKVVSGIRRDILSQKQYWGEVGEEGHYSDFDKFKNQIAKLVADRLYQELVNSGEVKHRIEIACEKAEKTINDRFNIEIGEKMED